MKWDLVDWAALSLTAAGVFFASGLGAFFWRLAFIGTPCQ